MRVRAVAITTPVAVEPIAELVLVAVAAVIGKSVAGIAMAAAITATIHRAVFDAAARLTIIS